MLASNSFFEIHSRWIFVSLGGGFFCALSNSAANALPIEMEVFAVAIRRKAIAVFSFERSGAVGGGPKREKSFLRPVWEPGLAG